MAYADQLGLFGNDASRAPPPVLPQGFRYADDVITPAEERELVRHIETLPLKEFEFHSFTGKRRVVSFGWRYDFKERQLQKVDNIPTFLLPLRNRTAAFASLPADELRRALVTEYFPGAAIGWHRDKAAFAEVIGISLLNECRFRLRRQLDGKWQRASLTLQPRSAYLLRAEARDEWEHSIPGVEKLRYSVTFRRFREGP